jgi:hypothetical protein
MHMNCLLARIAVPADILESPRKYVDDVPTTEDALALAKWTRAISDTAGYAVIDGETMQTKYVVFEGKIFELQK